MTSEKFKNLSLEDQNQLLRSILTSLPHVILILDIQKGQNIFVNESVFTKIGYTINEIHDLGTNVLKEILHPDDFEEIPELFEKFRTMKKDEIFVHTNRWKNKQGHYIWFRNQVIPFSKDEHENTISVLGISRDITKEIQTQKNILLQMEALENISYTVSHELRHEHTKVLGIIQLSKQGKQISSENLLQLSESISESTQKIDISIRELNNRITQIKNEFSEIISKIDYSNG
ncbi:MAG: PAS domain S-box protein [Chitinophagaceae bacterium]|jgi:PAS domain S-box-containing protein